MAKKKSKEVKSLKRKEILIPMKDFLPVYSNNVNMATSNYDISFSFGEIVKVDAKELVTQERARVYMTLEHAKAFLHALNSTIKKYEDVFGEVRFPLNPKS